MKQKREYVQPFLYCTALRKPLVLAGSASNEPTFGVKTINYDDDSHGTSSYHIGWDNDNAIGSNNRGDY